MPKFRPDQFFALLLLSGLFFVHTPSSQALAQRDSPIEKYQPLPPLQDQFSFPHPNTEVIVEFPYSAEAYISYDMVNGSILSEKNIHQRYPQASLTKLMTALIAIEEYKIDEVVSITHGEHLTTGNSMELQANEEIAVIDLLQGLLIYSANDAAMALAHHHPGGYDEFIRLMNQKAEELHLSNTHFMNPTGFDEYDHYSSAYDVAILAKEAFQSQTLSQIMQSSEFTVTSLNGVYQHSFPTTNQLLHQLEGLIAGKTGSTLLAGECLMTMTQREGQPIITVILGSKDRFSETTELINWVYNMYDWKQPIPPQ